MAGTQHAPGTFCWVELNTTEAAADAKSLYTKLFGWDYLDNQMGPEMIYSTCQINGKSAGALYETHDPNNPPYWDLYICVESAAATAAKAKDLGATVLMGPVDVMEYGSMAVLADPSGAKICLWEPKQHVGYEAVGGPGTHCWSELLVKDTAKAKAFYGELFGWVVDESMGDYTMFKPGNDAMAIAGLMGMTPEMGPMPPIWTPYFYVDNADDTVEIAKANGCRVLHGPEDVPGMVRFANIMDPAGAMFGVFHPLAKP